MNATISASDLAALLELYLDVAASTDPVASRSLASGAACACDMVRSLSESERAEFRGLIRFVNMYEALREALGIYAPILEMRRGSSCECDDGTKVRRAAMGYEYDGRPTRCPS